MNNILQLSALFLSELAFGSAIIMPFLALREIGKSFLRFYYGFIVICLALFLLCLHRMEQFNSNYLIITALAVWIWGLSFLKEHTKLEDYLIWVYAVFSAAMLVIYAQKYLFHGSDLLNLIFGLSALFVGALFLAFGLLNMIFGHWYLVNRQLPIQHLINTTRWMIILTYVRLAFTLFAIYVAKNTLDAERFSRLIDFIGHGVFFWSRLLAGLGIPVLVAHLAYSSAKIGSNQSATGIMYAGTVFILMGELLAMYLFMLTGVYF